MNNIKWDKILPHVIAVVLFFCLALFYNSALMDGNRLVSHDDSMYRGAAKEINDYRKAEKEEALWTNNMFSGMPAYTISYNPQNNLVAKVFYTVGVFLPTPAIHMFWALLCFYIMLLTFGFKPYASAVGAIAYGFCSYNIGIIVAGHYAKLWAIAFFPMIIAGINLLFKKKYLWGALLTGVATSIEILVNHPQMTYYYFVFFLSLYLGYLFIKAIVQKEIKHALIAASLSAAMILVGVGSNANKLLPTNEYTKYSTRGKSDLKQTANSSNQTGGLDKDYIVGYSSGKDDFYSFLVPNYKGSNSGVQLITDPTAKPEMGKNIQLVGQTQGLIYNQYGEIVETYWGGTDLAGGGIYCSVLIAVLFLLGIVFVKSPVKWLVLPAVIITIALSWGKNYMGLTNFFIDNFPMYNKFRAVNSMIIVATFCIPLLASFMLARMCNEPEFLEKSPFRKSLLNPENKKKLQWSIVITALLLIIAIGRITVKSAMTIEGSYDPTMFIFYSILIATIVVWMLINPQKFLNKHLLVAGLGSITFVFVFMYLMPTSVQSFMKPNHMVDKVGMMMSERDMIATALEAEMLKGIPKADVKPEMMVQVDKTVNDVVASIQAGRIAIFRADVKRSLMILLFGSIVLGLYAFKVYKWPIMITLVGITVLADVWTYDTRFLSPDTVVNGEKIFQPPKKADEKFLASQADQMILNDKSIHKRVLNLAVSPFNDGTTSYFHQSLGGYSGAKMKRYQELIEKGIYPDINTIYSGVNNPAKLDSVLSEVQVLNMLNTKYFIFPTEGGPVPVPNRHANGAAWTVRNVKFVEDADAELGALKTLNTKTEAVIDDDFKSDINVTNLRYDSTAKITMIKLSPKLLEYDYDSKEDQLVIFSEIYYPAGWTATIDGEESKIIRVNYVLRGLSVPKGKHKIEFMFEPESYKKGETYSILCSGILLLLAAGGVGYEIYRRRKGLSKK